MMIFSLAPLLAMVPISAIASSSAYRPGDMIFCQPAPVAGDTVTGGGGTGEQPFAYTGLISSAIFSQGAVVIIKSFGSGSTLAGGGTMTIRLKVGTVSLFTSQAYSVDNTVWYLDGMLKCTSPGVSGILLVNIKNGVGPGSSNFIASSGTSTSITGLPLNSDVTLSITVQYSVGSASNTATLNDFRAYYQHS